MKKYVEKNWIIILIGLWLATKALDIAYMSRGYKAIGSEILVLPVFLIAAAMVRKAVGR